MDTDKKKADKKKKKEFFAVGHGIDNFEEYINLYEIAYVGTSFKYDSQNEKWDYFSDIIFKSGTKIQVRLTEEGYTILSKKINKIKR